MDWITVAVCGVIFLLFLAIIIPRKCTHPFDQLAVYRDSTIVPCPKWPRSYNSVDIHLFCRKCGAGDLEKYGTEGGLTIKYAQSLRTHEEEMEEMKGVIERGEDPLAPRPL